MGRVLDIGSVARLAALVFTSLVVAGCVESSGEKASKSPTAKPSTMKHSRVERVEQELAHWLEDDRREEGATTFCEVEVVGIGHQGVVPAVEPSIGGGRSDDPTHGTPVYAYHWCEDFRQRGDSLESLSGGTSPIRFVVAGIDTADFFVVDQRQPSNGAGNLDSQRALFPDPYFERLRNKDGGRGADLGCAVVTRAREHFELPDAEIDTSDPCDPRG